MSCPETYNDGTHKHVCVMEHIPEATLYWHVCACGKDWNYCISVKKHPPKQEEPS